MDPPASLLLLPSCPSPPHPFLSRKRSRRPSPPISSVCVFIFLCLLFWEGIANAHIVRPRSSAAAAAVANKNKLFIFPTNQKQQQQQQHSDENSAISVPFFLSDLAALQSLLDNKEERVNERYSLYDDSSSSSSVISSLPSSSSPSHVSIFEALNEAAEGFVLPSTTGGRFQQKSPISRLSPSTFSYSPPSFSRRLSSSFSLPSAYTASLSRLCQRRELNKHQQRTSSSSFSFPLFSSSSSSPLSETKELSAESSPPSSSTSSSIAAVSPATASAISTKKNNVVESMKTMMLLLMWYAGNVFYNIENKKALNLFPLPTTVATIQMFVGIPIFILPWILGLRKVPTMHNKGWKGYKLFFFQGLWHSMVHLSAVVALGAGAISFVHIVKASEPAFTAGLSSLLMGQKLSVATILSLIPIIVGVGLASLKELSFTWKALIGAMLSNIGSSMRGIEAKKTFVNKDALGTNLSAPNVYSLLTIASAFILLPFVALDANRWMPVYRAAIEKGHGKWDILSHIVKSGFWYYLYNEVAFVALGRLNPLTHAVANTIKRIFLILTSVIVFGSQFTPLGAGGSAMAIAGTFLYSLCKSK